jgi:hypothetical protein
MQWWNAWRRRDEAQPDAAAAADLLLSSYLDGEVTAPERAAVERQLGDDAALRGALDDLREVVLQLGRLEDIAAPRVFMVTADAIPGRRGLTRLELGVRAGAVAAVAAFVFAVGLDALGGGSEGIRGQAAPLRAAVESAASFDAADAPSTTLSSAEDSTGAAAAPERAAAGTTESSVAQPAVVPTSLVAQPTPPAATATPTPPSSQRQQAQQGATPAATAVPTRTPPLTVTSTSTMTSALQGTATADTATGSSSPSKSITPPAIGAAPAIAPAGTPAATATPTATAPAPSPTPVKTDATPPATGSAGGGSAGGSSASSGSGGSAGAAPAAPRPALPLATPSPAPPEATPAPAPIGERPSAPAVVPPNTGGTGSDVIDSSPPRGGLLPVAPEAAGGGWGESTLRVSVTRDQGLDGLRATQIGLGALALGLGGMTGWLWYVRRREAVASSV